MSARILYIEDNESNMYLVDFLLKARGHAVLQAWDGHRGVEVALQEHPDLILLDIQLPGMDGYEIARRLRAESSLAAVPIIALTSYAMAGDQEKALGAGCDGYLEKPINPETFIASIERFLPAAPCKGLAMATILIVDDQADNRYLLETLLNGHGLATASAANGAEALALTSRQDFDLVIADILMPVMDGYALCRAWRQDARLALIPFVFYTATYTEPMDEQFGLSLGADRFLIKPMAVEDLLEVVLELLARGPRAPAAVPADEPAYLQAYNLALFRKLESKMAANARLQEEVLHFQKVESLGRMAGTIAHDLNNLLTPILSMAEILLEGYGDHPELHKRLATILVAAEQARSLVQELTEFARKDVPAFEPVDLNILVRQAVELLEADARPGIRWDLHLEAGLPQFPGAPVALGRVLLNLGRNAVDATLPSGSVRIATRTLDPGRVELTVADTGHGIPPELLAKVTEPFFTTKGRGTGLGLAIVQNIVRAHAGTLAVESQVGQGTCIRIILPIR